MSMKKEGLLLLPLLHSCRRLLLPMPSPSHWTPIENKKPERRGRFPPLLPFPSMRRVKREENQSKTPFRSRLLLFCLPPYAFTIPPYTTAPPTSTRCVALWPLSWRWPSAIQRNTCDLPRCNGSHPHWWSFCPRIKISSMTYSPSSTTLPHVIAEKGCVCCCSSAPTAPLPSSPCCVCGSHVCSTDLFDKSGSKCTGRYGAVAPGWRVGQKGVGVGACRGWGVEAVTAAAAPAEGQRWGGPMGHCNGLPTAKRHTTGDHLLLLPLLRYGPVPRRLLGDSSGNEEEAEGDVEAVHRGWRRRRQRRRRRRKEGR